MRRRGARDREDEMRLRERAEQFLEAAVAEAEAERRDVAFHLARHAAELAGKLLLQRADGEYPRAHGIGGRLHERGLTPRGLDPKDMARVLRQHTRGSYGFDEPVTSGEVTEAMNVARRLLDATAPR